MNEWMDEQTNKYIWDLKILFTNFYYLKLYHIKIVQISSANVTSCISQV